MPCRGPDDEPKHATNACADDNELDRPAVDFTIAVPDLVAVYFAIAGSNQAAYHQPVGVAFDVANYHADGVPDHLSDCAAFDVAIGIP